MKPPEMKTTPAMKDGAPDRGGAARGRTTWPPETMATPGPEGGAA